MKTETVNSVTTPKITQTKADSIIKNLKRRYDSSANWMWNGTPIQYLDSKHINSILAKLKSLNNLNLKHQGHTTSEWIKALKTEQNNRNQFADMFLATVFPKFNKKYKEAVKIALQQ